MEGPLREKESKQILQRASAGLFSSRRTMKQRSVYGSEGKQTKDSKIVLQGTENRGPKKKAKTRGKKAQTKTLVLPVGNLQKGSKSSAGNDEGCPAAERAGDTPGA